MSRLLIASVAVALAMPAVANAADLRPAPVMPTKAQPYMAPQFTWDGFYVGVNGGGGWGHARSDLTGGFGTSGGLVGGTAGYNAQFGNIVLGLEADIDWTNVGGTTANGCPAGNCKVQGNWLNTDRGRVGYAFGNFLPYVTGGLAVGDVKATVPGFAGQDQTQVGWTAGLGAEYAFTRNWSVKAEYLRVDLGSFNCGVNCGGTPVDNVSSRENVVRGGINLHF